MSKATVLREIVSFTSIIIHITTLILFLSSSAFYTKIFPLTIPSWASTTYFVVQLSIDIQRAIVLLFVQGTTDKTTLSNIIQYLSLPCPFLVYTVCGFMFQFLIVLYTTIVLFYKKQTWTVRDVVMLSCTIISLVAILTIHICILFILIEKERDNITFLGAGSYGSVHLYPKTSQVQKVFTVKTKETDVRQIEDILNELNPERDILGGKITKYSTDILQSFIYKRPMVESVRMTFQGKHNLEHLILSIRSHSNRSSLYDVFLMFENLIQGVVLLSTNGYVHGDIALRNIVYNDRTKRLVLIDFDFMNITPHIFSPLLEQLRHVYVPNLPPEQWLPIKFKLLRKKTYKENIYEFTSMMMDNHVFQNFQGISLDNVYNCFMNRTPFWTLNEWMTQFQEVPLDPERDMKKFDIYSLGLVAVELFFKSEAYALLRPLIMKMIHPNVRFRIQPSDALQQWRNLKTQINPPFNYQPTLVETST